MSHTKVLSNITSYLKYQRFLPHVGRKETWSETIARNKKMHMQKYTTILNKNPNLEVDINEAYNYVRDYKIMPSMRSLQFGGPAILAKESRIYNCCYLPITDVAAFRETMFLLLCGTGVGYSVQDAHVGQLPRIVKPDLSIEYYIGDSIEGWADAVHALMDAFLPTNNRTRYIPNFNGSLVRPRGSLIKSIGSIAPGPEILLSSLNQVKAMLMNKTNGDALTPLEVMDILNILSDCVMAGGVRRSAMICLFSPTNDAVLYSKTGDWYTKSPWRSRSNNSAVIVRGEAEEERHFNKVWNVLSTNGYGEPGFYFSSNTDWGTNPCVETALEPYQFCNLTEINGSTVESQIDLNNRVKYAALLGTLQAGYTNFNYLTKRWKKATEKDALLGVGITGIAHGRLANLSLREAARSAYDVNMQYSRVLGIKGASRLTCVKPSGTTSLVFGCTSGIHAAHSPYYIRRIRIGKHEPIYSYLVNRIPECVQDESGKEKISAVLSVPQKIEAIAYRDERVTDFLERVREYNKEWVNPGHVYGVNKHNVSATISIKNEEWGVVKDWLWSNRSHYTGISCLPYSGAGYAQMPFEECDQGTYNRMLRHFKNIDLENIRLREKGGKVELEPACAGGACEL